MVSSAKILAQAQHLEAIQIGDSDSNKYYFGTEETGKVNVYEKDGGTTSLYSAVTTKPVSSFNDVSIIPMAPEPTE